MSQSAFIIKRLPSYREGDFAIFFCELAKVMGFLIQ